MKKYFISFLTFAALTTAMNSKLVAQSELTCTMLDKIEEGTMQRKLDYKTSISGLKSLTEANDLCSRMSNAHSDIQSVTCTGTDGKGNYYVDLKMKKPQDFQFYRGLAIKYGFRYILVNGEKTDLLSKN